MGGFVPLITLCQLLMCPSSLVALLKLVPRQDMIHRFRLSAREPGQPARQRDQPTEWLEVFSLLFVENQGSSDGLDARIQNACFAHGAPRMDAMPARYAYVALGAPWMDEMP